MKFKAFAVIDTNVLISAALTPNGYPSQIFNLVGSGNIIPIFDERMLDEHYRVLKYPKFTFDEQTIYNTLRRIVENGILINDVEQAKVKLNDADDIPFFEVKESSKEFDSYLVTGNIKHFSVSDQPNPLHRTVTPEAMVSIMFEGDSLLKLFEQQYPYEVDYSQSVDNKIKQHLATAKYTSGKELIDEIFDTQSQKVKTTYFEQD